MWDGRPAPDLGASAIGAAILPILLVVLLAPFAPVVGNSHHVLAPSDSAMASQPLAGPYPVVFTETGLPARTNWTVTLNGTSQTSNLTAIQFFEADGTYPFTITPVPGYSASPSSGNLTVSGSGVSRSVSFVTGSGTGPTEFLSLPYWDWVVLGTVGGLVLLLLLLGLFGCPDQCKKGGKKNCSSSVSLETYPCGQGPGSTKDLELGADIIALGSKVAEKIEVVGESYAKILENMPEWITTAKKLLEKKIGVEVYATVVCKWLECKDVPCYFFWKQLDWAVEWRFYGPYKLKPGQGKAASTSAECFAAGLDAAELAQAIGDALASDERIAEGKKKCAQVCPQ